ncbi:GlsB/YeaQ/YmgE family stress response membrane protein [Devosia sp. FKR38]|uniref:GlsB/YeaQ/YmgE family stress response membrane protein n=1 Tax=Devosia sp. FKR38 TaxID=2562312 RepID=UPI0010C11B33|nr:GlsB/YeaQ/YmgE family stress response membrane protein [Devosia sp. FKR38]
MGIIWAIIIGFLAGLVAKIITPGNNKPSGFILTTVLGIVGSVVATWLGQAIGWYSVGDGAGFIASVIGAVIVLLVWGQIARRA